MRSLRVTLALAMLATAALSATDAAAQTKLPSDSLALARKWSQWFLTGRADSLATQMTPGMLADVGGVDGITGQSRMVLERAGMENRLVEERFVWRNGQRQYWRTMDMTVLPEPFLLRFVMLADGKIGGVGLGPVSQAPPTDSVGPAIKP